MIAAPASEARTTRVPPAIVVAIAGAWAIAVVAQLTGRAELFGHSALAEDDARWGVALGLFLVGWQLMIVAMMLPSSLPLVRMFRGAAASQPHPARVLAALFAGYALLGTACAAIALPLSPSLPAAELGAALAGLNAAAAIVDSSLPAAARGRLSELGIAILELGGETDLPVLDHAGRIDIDGRRRDALDDRGIG